MYDFIDLLFSTDYKLVAYAVSKMEGFLTEGTLVSKNIEYSIQD